ncbi:MAG: 4-hydroxybenzoyl-CoA reductase [Propionibacteriales bacterium]|nr:4-hydroxybenzoyl-CoA reductase [Propionibacteriales bacterium]
MSPTAFHEPADLADACALLAANPWGAKAISGGTAIVLMLRNGLIAPESFISLARIGGLRGIAVEDGVLRIGAGTTLAEVAASPAIREHAPSVASACELVGNPRVRNVATIGGNLAEADYASDPPATLASVGARCAVTGTAGRRTVEVIDLITGFYETVLEPDELITHVEIPLPAGPRGAVYLKYRTRSSEDRACVGVAARVDFRDGAVGDLDVVVAAVASTLQRVPDPLAAARGRRLEPPVIREVARGYADAIDPMDDARGSAGYRRKMIEVFVRRALEQVAGQQRGSGGGARG